VIQGCLVTDEQYCNHDRCWKMWLEHLERMTMEKERCQAILMTPKSRSWAKRTGQEIRCKWSAKPDSSFCGNHEKLSAFICEIVWKD
jgi:hypothetical protein